MKLLSLSVVLFLLACESPVEPDGPTWQAIDFSYSVMRDSSALWLAVVSVEERNDIDSLHIVVFMSYPPEQSFYLGSYAPTINVPCSQAVVDSLSVMGKS